MSNSTRNGVTPVVVVHGVGSPALGATAQEVVSALQSDDKPSERRLVELVGFKVPIASANCALRRVAIYEVNWADLQRPPKHLLALIFYAVSALVAIVQLGQTGWSGNAKGAAGRSFSGMLARQFFMLVTVWVLLLPTTALFAYILQDKRWATVTVVAIGTLCALAAFALRRSDYLLLSGIFWAFASIGIAVWGSWSGHLFEIAPATIRVAGLSHFIAGLLVIACMLETLYKFLRNRRETAEPVRLLLVRLALFILPFALAVGAGGALVGVLNFYVAEKFADPIRLKEIYGIYATLADYNIAFMEIVNATVTFSVGVFAIFAVIIWYLGTAVLGRLYHFRSGAWLRASITTLCALIIAGHIILLSAWIVDLSNSSTWVENFKLCDLPWLCQLTGASGSTLDIYSFSSLRIVPYLAFLVGPLSIAFDIMVDVLFYQLPSHLPLSTHRETIRRVATTIDFARKETGECPVVLAHSQGSRIAFDAVQEIDEPQIRLVTVGSPVCALHGRFLHIESFPRVGLDWQNLYRDSDFIGGKIGAKGVLDTVIDSHFTSSHFDYYREVPVIEAVFK